MNDNGVKNLVQAIFSTEDGTGTEEPQSALSPEVVAALNDSTNEKSKEVMKFIKEVVKIASAAAAEKAIEVYKAKKAETVKERKDKRLRNVKLLLKKYVWLTDYGKRAIYDLKQLIDKEDIEVLELMGLQTRELKQVNCIRDNVRTTRIMIGHVEEMLAFYKQKCLNSTKPEESRRWRVLESRYLLQEVTDCLTLSHQEHVDERTIFKDIDKACEDLATLIFGIDLENLISA